MLGGRDRRVRYGFQRRMGHFSDCTDRPRKRMEYVAKPGTASAYSRRTHARAYYEYRHDVSWIDANRCFSNKLGC